jgi:hypothetical protein
VSMVKRADSLGDDLTGSRLDGNDFSYTRVDVGSVNDERPQLEGGQHRLMWPSARRPAASSAVA